MKPHYISKLCCLTLTLSAFCIPQVNAAMTIDGTPDNDMDGDGDTFQNSYTYSVTDEDGASMQVDVSGTDGIEYWTTTQMDAPETNFFSDTDTVASPPTNIYFAAHLTEPLDNSDVIFIQSDYQFEVENPKIGFRAPYSNLPAGTTFYLGLRSSDPSATFNTADITDTVNFGSVGTTDPVTGGLTGVSSSVVNSYQWFSFDTLANDTLSTFEFNSQRRGNNSSNSGSSLASWALYIELPDANSVGDTGSWDDLSPTITPSATDVAFTWTISGSIDTSNPVVPEPSVLLLSGLCGVMAVFRRKRACK